MSSDLITQFKGCPFCGGEQTEDWGEPTWSGVRRWRYCVDCGAQGPRLLSRRGEDTYETQDRADAAWNERDRHADADALAAKDAEIERLRGALKGARDDMAAWGAYATEYFQEKHDLPGDLAKIDAALQPQEGEK